MRLRWGIEGRNAAGPWEWPGIWTEKPPPTLLPSLPLPLCYRTGCPPPSLLSVLLDQARPSGCQSSQVHMLGMEKLNGPAEGRICPWLPSAVPALLVARSSHQRGGDSGHQQESWAGPSTHHRGGLRCRPPCAVVPVCGTYFSVLLSSGPQHPHAPSQHPIQPQPDHQYGG